ncbi:MAG: phage holin family protein [Chloroflexota bacterium]
MRSFLLRAAIIAVAIVVAMQLLPDLGFHGSMSDLVVVAAILGAINALVRPVVQLLALPVRLVTLGLATFIVDAAMLLLAAWVAGQVGIAFSVGGFPPDLSLRAVGVAIVGSLIVSAISTATSLVVPD